MILIESVKYYEVEHDPITIPWTKSPYVGVPVMTNEGEDIVSAAVLTELCRGRRFVRADGTEITIAMSQDVQELLGMPLDLWDDMQADLDVATINSEYSEKKIDRIEGADFWTRLKWLFTGVK